MAGPSVNKVILLGNLGKDPELRYTPSGKAVATFSLATTSMGGRDRESTTEWHNIVVWDKLAEQCSQYLAKGRQAYLEGRIQTRSWDDKQSGQKRFTTEIVADRVIFLGSQGAGAGQGAGPGQARPAPRGDAHDGPAPRGGRGQQYQDQGPDFEDVPPATFADDDDIPF